MEQGGSTTLDGGVNSGGAINPARVFDFDTGSDISGGDGLGGGSRGNGSDGKAGSGQPGNSDPGAPYGRTKTGRVRNRPVGERKSFGGTPQAAPSRSVRSAPAIDAIAGTLLSIHATIATFAQVPELEIYPDDAKQIAKATADLVELYGGGIDPRAMAWTNLILVLGSVYGARALGYYLRTKEEARQRAAQANTAARS